MDGELDCRSDETRAVPLLARFSVRCCFVEHAKIKNYTDFHNVDEDEMAILSQGAGWSSRIDAGITRRNLYNTPSYVATDVASSDI